MTSPSIKGLVVAGTHSGCGKTSVTLALLAALKRRGQRIAPFKVGPDFIDPGHHTQAAETRSRNLDGWMLDPATCRRIFRREAANADLAVVEGVMGLFDGYDGRSEAGSTAQMAKWLGLPVLLVVDARSMARSAAALVSGFEQFDPDLCFCGVVFNRVAGDRHLSFLEQALAGHVDMPCVGGLPRQAGVAIPDRHLGLVTSEDHPLGDEALASLAAWMEESMNLDALIANLPPTPLPPASRALAPSPNREPVRIAVARDEAFCFYYQDNLDALAQNGAEIVPVSPVHDSRLPEDICGLYLGGGYPELHAHTLSKNVTMRNQVHALFERGLPIYGECGGFMYLCRSLKDGQGRTHSMAGCFPFTCAMSKRLRTLGYREVSFLQDTILGLAGTRARGHEFHYSFLMDEETHGSIPRAYRLGDKAGRQTRLTGFWKKQCLGSYVHLHFLSNPAMAHHFVASCRKYKNREEGAP